MPGDVKRDEPDLAPAQLPRTFVGWLRLWFLLSDPVGRKAYVRSGVGLMLLKYVVEALAIRALAGLFYSPLDFINPSITAREIFLHGAPQWLGLAWVFWTLPFLWIATGMSVRRAFDAGISPWHGLWVLAPVVNFIAMLLLAVLPSAAKPASYWDPAQERLEPYKATEVSASLRAAIGSIAIGAVYSFVTILFSIYVLKSYGVTLFFGTPFITGIAAGYLFNRDADRSLAATVSVAFAAVLLTGVGMLLFAFEGIGCLFMAAPIMAPLGALGAPRWGSFSPRNTAVHAHSSSAPSSFFRSWRQSTLASQTKRNSASRAPSTSPRRWTAFGRRLFLFRKSPRDRSGIFAWASPVQSVHGFMAAPSARFVSAFSRPENSSSRLRSGSRHCIWHSMSASSPSQCSSSRRTATSTRPISKDPSVRPAANSSSSHCRPVALA